VSSTFGASINVATCDCKRQLLLVCCRHAGIQGGQLRSPLEVAKRLHAPCRDAPAATRIQDLTLSTDILCAVLYYSLWFCFNMCLSRTCSQVHGASVGQLQAAQPGAHWKTWCCDWPQACALPAVCSSGEKAATRAARRPPAAASATQATSAPSITTCTCRRWTLS
jgi:hypothetical protein